MDAAIKDWNEFERLYKVPLPYHKEAAYYLSVLQRLTNYDWLPNAINNFVDLEARLAQENTTKPRSVSDYKQWAMQLCSEELVASPVWKHFQAASNTSAEPAPEQFDRLANANPTAIYAEIDIQQANYNIIRALGAGGGPLPERWETWAETHGPGIHPGLVQSKSFRQLVFGHLDSQAIRRAQLDHITKLANCFTVVRLQADSLTLATAPQNASAIQDYWAAFPRVARGSQPWAWGRNPFGIQLC